MQPGKATRRPSTVFPLYSNTISEKHIRRGLYLTLKHAPAFVLLPLAASLVVSAFRTEQPCRPWTSQLLSAEFGLSYRTGSELMRCRFGLVARTCQHGQDGLIEQAVERGIPDRLDFQSGERQHALKAYHGLGQVLGRALWSPPYCL